AVAWIGIYVSLNLQVLSFGPLSRSSIAIPMGPFYWFTYIAIWLIPVSGLYLALRARERPLLDVSIGLTLLTLATNKAYLGIAGQTWYPIILVIFLIAAAVILKRRLSSGNRDGFTAERILLADERGLSALG